MSATKVAQRGPKLPQKPVEKAKGPKTTEPKGEATPKQVKKPVKAFFGRVGEHKELAEALTANSPRPIRPGTWQAKVALLLIKAGGSATEAELVAAWKKAEGPEGCPGAEGVYHAKAASEKDRKTIESSYRFGVRRAVRDLESRQVVKLEETKDSRKVVLHSKLSRFIGEQLKEALAEPAQPKPARKRPAGRTARKTA